MEQCGDALETIVRIVLVSHYPARALVACASRSLRRHTEYVARALSTPETLYIASFVRHYSPRLLNYYRNHFCGNFTIVENGRSRVPQDYDASSARRGPWTDRPALIKVDTCQARQSRFGDYQRGPLSDEGREPDWWNGEENLKSVTSAEFEPPRFDRYYLYYYKVYPGGYESFDVCVTPYHDPRLRCMWGFTHVTVASPGERRSHLVDEHFSIPLD